MKRLLPLLALLALQSAPAFAQQDDGSVRLGLGLSDSALLDFISEDAASLAGIYLPITFSSFRVEPAFGIYRSSREDDNTETTTSVLHVGTGIFLLRPRGATTLYAGGRIGINRTSEEFSFGDEDDSESSTDLFLGPAAGGEYLFNEHFSLGGEVQILYTSVGDPDDDDSEVSVLRTRGLFFVRWHF